MKKILIIDHEPEAASLQEDYLRLAGYETSQATTAEEGLYQAFTQNFDLILLDLFLPDLEGLEVLKRIRKEMDIPLLAISASSESIDIIRGLDAGADDYIVKPFCSSELAARVKAHLNRYQRLTAVDKKEIKPFWVQDVKIDPLYRKVWVKKDEITLTDMELRLLLYLAEHPNRVLSKKELYRQIWQMEEIGDLDTVRVHIRKLRSKLKEKERKEKLIETIWGAGYRFNSLSGTE